MNVIVVLNSKAGSLLGQPLEPVVDRIRELFLEAGHTVSVEAATGPELTAALARACAAEADVVVVGGGDGTVTSAAARLTDTPSALGVLPLGTMNLLARDIGVPLELDEAVRALAAGEIKAVDAAEVNGHVFLNHSVLGLYPRLVEEREHTRKAWHLHKWPAMAVAWAKVLRTKPMVDVDLLVGGESRRFRTPALAVANNAYADTGFLSRDRLDTGELAVYVAQHEDPGSILTLAVRIARGGWKKRGRIETILCTEATVHSRRKRLKLANDGEVLHLKPPLHYRSLAGCLRMLMPRVERPRQSTLAHEEPA